MTRCNDTIKFDCGMGMTFQLFSPSLISQFNANMLRLQKLNQFKEEELRKLIDVYEIKNPKQPVVASGNFPLFETPIAGTLKII